MNRERVRQYFTAIVVLLPPWTTIIQLADTNGIWTTVRQHVRITLGLRLMPVIVNTNLFMTLTRLALGARSYNANVP